MSLWGATDLDESKPKHLTTAEKKNVYATTKGWVKPAGGNGNTSADAEVLVAIGGLSTSIGAADITGVEWITTTFSAAEGGTLSMRVRWNEPVDVVEAGTGFKMTLDRTGNNNHTLRYASGTGTNELVFSSPTPIAGGGTSENDVISLPAGDLVKAGATSCKDATGTASDASVTISSAQATAASTLTVTA
jgi:hypothetical protein